jgi:hypothetical protein
MLEKGRKEAIVGLESEEEIMFLINKNAKFRENIKRGLFTLGFKIKGKISAYKDDVKTDIFIKIDDTVFGVSIKSSTGTSFHQLDRRRLEDWKSLLDMPDDIFDTLKKAILRIAHNAKACFILPEDRHRISEFFLLNIERIINEIFVKNEQSLKLLMINDKVKRKLYLFKIEDVIRFLMKNAFNISFSKKGIIKLGDFITIQRKSGDGRHIKIPKTEWSHPGNELQFKFSPIKFAEYVKDTKIIPFYYLEMERKK